MNIETIREYCLAKKEVSESLPFDDSTLVFKVSGKMFLLLNLGEEPSINLKCDPEKAVALREQYPSVLPGYHMNKRYWNTVLLDGSVQDILLKEWIDHSYREVVGKLPKSRREAIK
jgi:predicted DNA-binding protein (MmcQ/YjbR family)